MPGRIGGMVQPPFCSVAHSCSAGLHAGTHTPASIWRSQKQRELRSALGKTSSSVSWLFWSGCLKDLKGEPKLKWKAKRFLAKLLICILAFSGIWISDSKVKHAPLGWSPPRRQVGHLTWQESRASSFNHSKLCVHVKQKISIPRGEL